MDLVKQYPKIFDTDMDTNEIPLDPLGTCEKLLNSKLYI